MSCAQPASSVGSTLPGPHPATIAIYPASDIGFCSETGIEAGIEGGTDAGMEGGGNDTEEGTEEGTVATSGSSASSAFAAAMPSG